MSQTLATFSDFARGRVLPHDRMMLVLLTLALFVCIFLRGAFS